jgi:hypothetical protein
LNYYHKELISVFTITIVYRGKRLHGFVIHWRSVIWAIQTSINNITNLLTSPLFKRWRARVAQWVRQLDYLTTHTGISPIRHGIAPDFVICKKECTRLAAASDKVYQLLAHGRWFSPSTPASFTTKTGRHDIGEILLKVVLKTKNQSLNVGQYSVICVLMAFPTRHSVCCWQKMKIECRKKDNCIVFKRYILNLILYKGALDILIYCYISL